MKNALMIALVAGSVASSALGQSFVEIEDNNDRSQANTQGVVNLSTTADGITTWSGITGTATGSSTTATGLTSVDIFRVRTAAAAPGIYRNRLTLTTNGTAGHTGIILGLNTTSTGPGVDAVVGTTSTTIQTSSTATTPARFNQWYTFGPAADIYYRVGGVAATTVAYSANYSQDVITPIAGPSVQPGSIRLNTIGAGIDTDMWIYDSNFNPIALYGNDDSSVSTSLSTSDLTRNFAPGTYYVAVSRYNLAHNLASPGDDDFRTGGVLDFGGSVLGSSSTATAATFNLTFIDSGGLPVTTPVTLSGGYDVQFVSFTVVPTPGAAALLGLGGLVAARRRRA